MRIQHYIDCHNTTELEPLDEIRLEKSWTYLGIRSNGTLILKEQSFQIDHKDLLGDGLWLEREEGGIGARSWKVQYKRKKNEKGVLHAKFYAQKQNKYRLQISLEKTELLKLINKRRILEEKRKSLTGQLVQQGETIDKMVRDITTYVQLISMTQEDQIKLDLFQALVEAGAYQGRAAAQRVAATYTEALDKEESETVPKSESESESESESKSEEEVREGGGE